MSQDMDGKADTELRRALESQDQFMSFLSHEIRGSLNGMVLLVEVVKREIQRRGGAIEPVLGDVEMLKRSIYDAVAKMDRALLADRIRRGRVEPDPEPLDLADAVECAVNSVVKDLGGNVSMNLTPGIQVNTDAGLLGRVVTSLVANALQHGNPPVEVILRRAGHQAEIVVRNHGEGLDGRQVAWLLDPNRRPDSKHKGLGLVTSVQIVRLLGGVIEADQLEGGMEFRVRL